MWSAAPIATTILAIAVAASLVFGARAAMYWVNHPQPEQAVAAWMTPRYVARSWRVPPEIVINAIGIPDPRPMRPMSLSDLAALRGVPVADVIAEAQAAIAAFRAGQGNGGTANGQVRP